MSDWVLHQEKFDNFDAMISGDKLSCRLTIFRERSKQEMAKLKKLVGSRGQVSPCRIVFQADANGILAVKKLKSIIGDYRYDLIREEYIDLRKFGK